LRYFSSTSFSDFNRCIPSGEFSLYDHVLDHSAAFNVIPKRYLGNDLSPLDIYFAMGRGRQAEGVDVPACEMKKWYAVSILI
jgi:5-methyltetrahydropteroyltriglutamate--homocysteine methyltransferase